MRLVVSDNSPLGLLVRLSLSDILPALFHRVSIPPEVVREMEHPKAPAAVRAFIVSPPEWLTIQAPKLRRVFPTLDPGEAAAISLAAELDAALLIDETDGRREAQSLGLTVVGAIGVLEQAADAEILQDLAAVHAQIRTLRFHVADAVLQASLNRHLANSAKKKRR